VSVFRTGNHDAITLVRHAQVGYVCTDGSCPDRGNHLAHEDDELVAVVVNGDRELAERICGLLNASDGLAAQCTEETWSWRHFNSEQTDGYWISCDLSGPHVDHKDEHTGLTWRSKS
jgi:hypothetical protein